MLGCSPRIPHGGKLYGLEAARSAFERRKTQPEIGRKMGQEKFPNPGDRKSLTPWRNHYLMFLPPIFLPDLGTENSHRTSAARTLTTQQRSPPEFPQLLPTVREDQMEHAVGVEDPSVGDAVEVRASEEKSAESLESHDEARLAGGAVGAAEAEPGGEGEMGGEPLPPGSRVYDDRDPRGGCMPSAGLSFIS